MGKNEDPRVVFGTGPTDLSALKEARDAAYARETKDQKLPVGPGAASSKELSSPEDLEAAEKNRENLLIKIEAEFSRIFDWQEIEKAIINRYTSRTKRVNLQKRLEDIKKSFLETVQAAPGSFLSLDESGLEKIIKQYANSENDKINQKDKIFHSIIAEICQTKYEPPTKPESVEASGGKLTSSEFKKRYWHICRKNLFAPNNNSIYVLEYSAKDGKVLVGFENVAYKKGRETHSISIEELDDLLKIYTIDKKKNEKLLAREKSEADRLGQAKLKRIADINITAKTADETLAKKEFLVDFDLLTSRKDFYKNFSKEDLAELEQYVHLANEAIEAALNNKKKARTEYLERQKRTSLPGEQADKKIARKKDDKERNPLEALKEKISGKKNEVFWHLSELFYKELLRPRHKREARRFKKDVLISKKFKLDGGKINTGRLSDEEKEEFKRYFVQVNSEIEQKVNERAAELDEFLASISKKEAPPGKKAETDGEKKEAETVPSGLEKLKADLDKGKIIVLRELTASWRADNFNGWTSQKLKSHIDDFFKPDNYRISLEYFSTDKSELNKLTEEEVRKLKGYIEVANLEIGQKVGETRQELEEILKKLSPETSDGQEENLEEITTEEILPLEGEVSGPEKMETGKRQEEVYEYGSEGELLGVREDLEPGEKKEEAFNPRWRISILGAESTSEKIGKGEKYPAKTESEEEKEQRRAERTEKIESLKKEVEGSRKEYLEADYKKKKAYKRIWDFFGSLAKNNEEADWEQDQDLAYYRGVYDNNLFDLRNLLLEEAKEKGVSNKELGELLKVFTVEANMNLADVHDQVKIEHHEGKFSDFIRQHSMEMVQWYKNLPPHKKIAIAVAFSGAALGAGAIGGSIVGITASAITIRRAFMGMVTGTGVAMGLEAKARADRESKVADSHDKHAASIEGLNVDEKFEHLAAAIEKLIKDEDNKLQKIKNKNLRNLAIGTSVGTLVGSAGYWIGMLKETEAAKEIFGGIKGGLNSIAEKFGYQIGAPSAVPEMPKTSSVISEAGPKTPANIGLEVKSGGSLEGTIIEHLEQSGISAEEAGRKAHAMAVEYANEHGLENGPYSLVQPGAHIALSPDGSKISEISGRGLGYLPEKEIPTEIGHEAVPETAPEPAVPEEDIVPPTAAEAGNDMPDLEVPSNGTGEYVMDHETSDAINKMDLEIKSLSGQLGELDDKILKVSSGQYESVQIWPSPERMLEDLTAQKQVLEATKEEMITRIYAGHVGSLNKFLSGGDIEKWKEIKDMRAWDLLERRESIAHKFYDRILESNSKDMAGLKEHISPARGETVKDWILRVGKVMRKLGIKKNN